MRVSFTSSFKNQVGATNQANLIQFTCLMHFHIVFLTMWESPSYPAKYGTLNGETWI